MTFLSWKGQGSFREFYFLKCARTLLFIHGSNLASGLEGISYLILARYPYILVSYPDKSHLAGELACLSSELALNRGLLL